MARCALHKFSIIRSARLDTCLFHAWMFDHLSVVTGTESKFISGTTVKETSLRGISEHFDMAATQLVIRWQIPEF